MFLKLAAQRINALAVIGRGHSCAFNASELFVGLKCGDLWLMAAFCSFGHRRAVRNPGSDCRSEGVVCCHERQKWTLLQMAIYS